MIEIGYRVIDDNDVDNFKCIWDWLFEVIEDWLVFVLYNYGVLYIFLRIYCLVSMVLIYIYLRCSFLNI